MNLKVGKKSPELHVLLPGLLSLLEIRSSWYVNVHSIALFST